MKVLLIANYAENIGGIAVQVKLQKEKLCSEGIDCTIFSTKGNLIKRIVAPIRLLAKGRKYDVFHIHACSNRGFLPAVIGISTGTILRKKTILTYHGGGADDFFRHHTRFVKHYLKKTDANIVLSGFLAAVYGKYDIPCIIAPNIIEMPSTRAENHKVIRPDYICTRSFTETYNIECLLKAFKTVKSFVPEATLTLLGDGPLRSNLEQYVNANHISNVVFLGQVENAKIPEYLEKASIMVSPSKFDNLPVSILEGFNAGLVVIASNVGGVPYIIDNGVNGFLFESDNDIELARIMKDVLAMNTAPIIASAYESLSHYTWNYCRNILLPLYYN